jgi:hypothetical protein
VGRARGRRKVKGRGRELYHQALLSVSQARLARRALLRAVPPSTSHCPRLRQEGVTKSPPSCSAWPNFTEPACLAQPNQLRPNPRLEAWRLLDTLGKSLGQFSLDRRGTTAPAWLESGRQPSGLAANPSVYSRLGKITRRWCVFCCVLSRFETPASHRAIPGMRG